MKKESDNRKLSPLAEQEVRILATLLQPLLDYIATLVRENLELKGEPYFEQEHHAE